MSNLLVIMADQFTPFMMGCYGHPTVMTPNLDRLAARSIRFDAAYTPSPICVTARAGFMTGRYPSLMGCYDNGDSFPSLVPTFAHYLTNAGYDVTLSGKMHFVGADQLHGFRRRLTTDVYPSSYDWTYDPEEFGDGDLAFDFYQQYQAENTHDGWSLELQFDEETHYRSLEYLRRQHSADEPFALVASYTSPHPPFISPKPFWDLYDGVEIAGPDLPADLDSTYSWMDRTINHWYGLDRFDLLTGDHVATVRRGYAALITFLDAKVGELLAVLDEQGLTDSTTIVFTADHGEMLFEHGMIQKRSFYDWSSRIPLLVSRPGDTQQSVVDTPVSLLDVGPTLLDLAEVEPGGRLTMEGRGLLGPIDDDREVVSEYHAEGVFRPCFMVRHDRYKYVWFEDEEPQLFDLHEDPGEWSNRASDPALRSVRADLHARLANRFDVGDLGRDVAAKIAQKRIVREAMHRNDTDWDHQPFFDATKQYVRTDATKSYVRT